MQDFELDILKANNNRILHLASASDDFDLFKSWSSDLQNQFPSGEWKTVNGAKVFLHEGKVIAGLDGFNGKIDEFFNKKETEEKPKLKATVRQIFDKIQGLNPKTSTISSMGNYISESAKVVADSYRKEIMEVLPKNSVAYSIAKDADKFSERQLWAIAYELEKNAEYSDKVAKEIQESKEESEQKRESQKAKLADNKEASQKTLDHIKNNGGRLADYYKFIKDSKIYAREFYSKNFSMNSANAFLNKDKPKEETQTSGKDIVIHPTFGKGSVVSKDDRKITINFSGTEKTLLLQFANLKTEDGKQYK